MTPVFSHLGGFVHTLRVMRHIGTGSLFLNDRQVSAACAEACWDW